MNKFNVNFARLALLLLPTFWRKPIITGIACSATSHIDTIYTQLISFRTYTNYRLTHNGQVCYLRAVLNDLFDPENRQITITDNSTQEDSLYLHLRQEINSLIIYNRHNSSLMVNRRGFGGVNGFDFIVNIPSEPSSNINSSRVNAVINTYKLASKRFLINYI